jgi:hypothetical protein
MFTVDFFQTLLLAVVTAVIGGIALWTWQRAYWDYQLKRQRQDWMLRQCYARRDSQRRAMEELLVEMNRSLEAFLTTTEGLLSALVRAHDLRRQQGTQDVEKWKAGVRARDQAVAESTQEFNEAEPVWLADSRVLSGKIRLYFGEQSAAFEERWGGIIQESANTCQLFNDGDMQAVWKHVHTLRTTKNDLLRELQEALDAFVQQKLELPSQN